MQKHILSISVLFLVIILANSLKIASTIGYYALFTEDFVERYCVNKERPELNCDGKCELAKMLVQESDDDVPPINFTLLTTDVVLFLPLDTSIDFKTFRATEKTGTDYLDLYDFNFVAKKIHPPRT